MSRSECGRAFALLLAALCLPLNAAASALTNRLAQHPSPYLALHGSDPVAWQEWNADTVTRARRENKLLFVSVGYFACHWCHVMQRESFKNAQIAALLNRDYIPVKVDREINSGLDDALQTFSAQLNGIAGWPLNAFITPEGYPMFVVLYATPDEFRTQITHLNRRWVADRAGLRNMARQAALPPARPPVDVPLTRERAERAWQQFVASAWKEADTLHGGFGQISKFPMAPQLHALLERQARQPDAKLDEFLRQTFDQMANRGLRDHVGGGFFPLHRRPGVGYAALRENALRQRASGVALSACGERAASAALPRHRAIYARLHARRNARRERRFLRQHLCGRRQGARGCNLSVGTGGTEAAFVACGLHGGAARVAA